MNISISAITDVGHERENNEDAFAICPDLARPDWSKTSTQGYVKLSDSGALLIVADGMGGPNAGEVASALAIDNIKDAFSKQDDISEQPSEEAARKLISQAIVQADDAINKQMFVAPETAGMGTTIVVCWLRADKAHIAWCGDSRCYAYSKDKGLRPLTKDHSYVQELVDRGELTEEEAYTHPDNNIITRGLGDFDNSVAPDFVTAEVTSGDSLLLCSDGLCGYCTNDEIEAILNQCHTDTPCCANKLVKLALDAGGQDNICVAVVTLLDDDDVPHESKFKTFFKNIFG